MACVVGSMLPRVARPSFAHFARSPRVVAAIARRRQSSGSSSLGRSGLAGREGARREEVAVVVGLLLEAFLAGTIQA
jgi:hypothetical protein